MSMLFGLAFLPDEKGFPSTDMRTNHIPAMDQMAGFNTIGEHIKESMFARCYTKAEWDEFDKNMIMPPAEDPMYNKSEL